MLFSVLYYYGLELSGTAGCKPDCLEVDNIKILYGEVRIYDLVWILHIIHDVE